MSYYDQLVKKLKLYFTGKKLSMGSGDSEIYNEFEIKFMSCGSTFKTVKTGEMICLTKNTKLLLKSNLNEESRR